MTDHVKLENVRGFVPCQHNLTISENLEKITQPARGVFETQESNIKFILTNILENKEVKKFEKDAHIPEASVKIIYNEVAQRQLEKEMMAIKRAKFSREYDDVAPSPESDM